MERIASLIEQLQQALQRNADMAHMLMLTNMLQAELEKAGQQKNGNFSSKNVAVVLPISKSNSSYLQPPSEILASASPEPEESKEKILEVLQVDEKEVEAELEEIRQKAEYAKRLQAKQVQQKSPLLFDEEPGMPTLIHQPDYVAPPQKQNGSKEVNEAIAGEGRSINDHLKEEKAEVGHKLTESSSIKDLKKAIGINDRFVFINELFRGDESMYERSIKTINNFSIYPEAQYWMERELKIKLAWDNSRPAVQEFYTLVKRRFS